MQEYTQRQIDDFGRWDKVTYTAPDGGGYVRIARIEWASGGWTSYYDGLQVCELLYSSGPTLTCGEKGSENDLKATIQRERRRAMAAERRARTL